MNYEATAVKVAKSIEKAGKPVTIRRVGSAEGWTREYDPAVLRDKWTNNTTGTVVYVDPSTNPAEEHTQAVEGNYSAAEIDGTMVLRGDRQYLVPAQEIAQPGAGDRLIDGSDDLQVINCKRISPGTVLVLYEVQCRG